MQPWLAPYLGYLLEVLEFNGRPYTITSMFRSRERQAQLYDRYRAGLSQYPAAPPGSSYHEVGRAMDVSAEVATLEQLGAVWQSMGGTWGGARDPIHFQA